MGNQLLQARKRIGVNHPTETVDKELKHEFNLRYIFTEMIFLKKKEFIILMICILLLLFFPIPSGVYKDGGTRAFTAATYKLVMWHCIDPHYEYVHTSVYWLPDNFNSIDELWEIERTKANL